MSAVALRYFARERGEGRMQGDITPGQFDVVVCVKYAVTVRVLAVDKDEAEELAQQLVQQRAPLLASKGGGVEELDICVHKVTPR